MTIYAVGHKIPDSDSICGAIALAYLKNQIGEPTIATRLGDISPETAFILEKFGVEAPELKLRYANEKVFIVDHSELTQAPDDIDEATIVGIVDHHKLGDLTTSTPLECWIRPVGCSNTVIKMMYDFYGVEIPANIAGIMLCAILSDTVIFKSPTCTTADIRCVEDLAKIAGVDDVEALGMEMFNNEQQAALDKWVAGELSEKEFLRESRWYENWGSDFELYRELLEYCRDQGIPVIGLNVTKALGRKVSMTPLDELDEATRAQLPEMDMNDPYQQAMIEEIFGAHGAGATMLDSFKRRQTLWDETMAASVADYMRDRADHRMLVVAGGWHVSYGFGIPRRVHRRLPLPYVLVGGENLEVPEEKLDQLMDVELPGFPMKAVDYLVYQTYEVFKARGVRLGVGLDDSDELSGLLVTSVEADSNASEAGINEGDRLLRIDGESLGANFDLIYALKIMNPGSKASIDLQRGDEVMTLEVNFSKPSH